MNKKGKNKKGKVPNPSPSQEVKVSDNDFSTIGDEGNSGKTSEIIENIEDKIESVKEERVPEIISEVIEPSVEVKDEETPKKPKRNRGKKKKGNENDFEDNVEEESKEIAKEPALTEVKQHNPEIEPLDAAIVTPTARKKKNKKKNVDQNTEQPIQADLGQLTLVSSTPEVAKQPEIKEIKQEIPSLPESEEQDIKPSKKKNKKKKRTDSERSEKEEISCTSAFQKLIAAQNESLELKTEDKVEDNVILIESIKTETEILPEKNTLLIKIIAEKNTEHQEEIISSKGKDLEQLPVAESKGKKKNKKDKKQIPTSVENISTSDEGTKKVAFLSEDTKHECSKDSIQIENPGLISQETSPKPKAKIAKPVEKKRKGNQESQSTENIPHDISVAEPMRADEQLTQVALESAEMIAAAKEIRCKDGEKHIQSDCPKEPFVINIPETTPEQFKETGLEKSESLNIHGKATSKKRKKEPKIPRTPDVSFEILESTIEIDTKQPETEIVSINKDLPIISEFDIIQKQEASAISETSEVPTTLDSEIQSKLTVELIPQCDTKSHVLLTPESLEETEAMKLETAVTEKKEDTQKIEMKSVKKRKKSPKKVDHKQKEPAAPAIIPTEETLPTPELTKETEEKIDVSNITRIYDIEISSIKADESDGLLCDTIPDVTYPRSVSQQLMDDNNNNSTIITEILPSQDIILDTQKLECVKTPKIVKSKETTNPPKEEKTDIKSKMMEVNQDMEELRLSIERSLAELTAIEKSEELTEKRYEESKLTTEGNMSKIPHTDVISIKDDHEKPEIKLCDKPDAEKTALEDSSKQIKSTEMSVADTQDSEIKSKIHLMQPDDTKKSRVAKKLQKDLIVIKSDIPECATQSECKEKSTEVLKHISPTVDTVIDSVVTMITDQEPVNISDTIVTMIENKMLTEQVKNAEFPATATSPTSEKNDREREAEKKDVEIKQEEQEPQLDTPPICPARKDPKNKHKKKKGKQDSQATSQPAQSTQSTTSSQSTASTTQEAKKQEKTDTKNTSKGSSKDTKEKGKQQASTIDAVTERDLFSDMDYEPIENFEDALTSSVDDVNKTFELIVKESQEQSNPKINIIPPNDQKSHVSPPKNLLGHPDIPVSSNKRDYKKEKDKIPNEITAAVRIQDAVHVERKQSKNTQTVNKLKDLNECKLSENEEFVYKYNFRKVFLQSYCHLCKKDLGMTRVACCYCNLVFYCGIKHKDEDWPLHQALCFAVSTIGHLKDQKHIYADTKNVTGHDFRLVRMQMIVSCEKILKRRLVPWEQEALLYPRVCAHVPCREWRQMKLSDCQGCGQISFCTDNQDHFPKSHSRWCKSYSLYQKLVCYQQTQGRLEPRLPTKVMQEPYTIPENINEVLAAMYEEKIDMNDLQYAALTQLATAPLTAAYCHQLCGSKDIKANGYKKSIFTIHVVGAELQFEADALNKWEVFFLHLRPDLQELRVVLINYDLNPSNLPLELLGKIKLCEQCRQDKRRVVLRFQDKRTYAEYKRSEDFIVPDIVCAFNSSIQRSSVYNGKDPWPSAVNVILKQKIPFIVTGYTVTELRKDCIRVKECCEIESNFISEPKINSFASVRPDRNFITDDEMPLLFKNYCYAIICG